MHTAVVEKRYALNRKFREKRQAIATEEKTDLAALQKECEEIGHVWKYKQIAGEGKYCTICGLETNEDD